jgi:hypothetical protein
VPNKTAQPDWLETAAREAREVIARLHAEAKAAFDAIDSSRAPASKPESTS